MLAVEPQKTKTCGSTASIIIEPQRLASGKFRAGNPSPDAVIISQPTCILTLSSNRQARLWHSASWLPGFTWYGLSDVKGSIRLMNCGGIRKVLLRIRSRVNLLGLVGCSQNPAMVVYKNVDPATPTSVTVYWRLPVGHSRRYLRHCNRPRIRRKGRAVAAGRCRPRS